MHEIQIDNILAKAKNLKSIITEPLAKKVLEIEINAKSSKNQELLSRLIRSLDQYVNKNEHLIYLGFVGHYSSGKSSTINNILNLKGTPYERSTGLNPTDKAITLITHESNSNALILMTRETGNVPVRTSLIARKLLNKIVIADTPGSGDPQVVNEMIQDFLPICDYIIYFISAANPVDQADLPLLEQKTHNLPFIPTIFVITRTDEFRVDKMQSLNDENIDKPKKDQFIGQLLSRIKEILGSDSISINDFLFIDNEFNYGIDILIEKLSSWAVNIDQHTLVQIHGHKVEYYKTNLDLIYQHFIAIIEEKIKKSKEFVKTANENIQRFDKRIELNNEKLKTLWTRGDTHLKGTHADEKKVLLEISNNSYLKDVTTGEKIIQERKVINKTIEDLANGYLGKLVFDLNNQFRQRIREVKQNLITNISESNLLHQNISHLFPGKIDFSESTQKLDIDFSKLNESLIKYQEKITDLLTETKNSLKNKVIQFKTQSSKETLVKTIEFLYDQGEKNINENFDQYFERIQMYRSTVLTRNTKETIEKLRIGTQLDELDDEFSDDYILEMKQQAILEVYFQNEKELADFQRFNEEQNSSLQEIRREIDNVIVPNSVDQRLPGKENIDVSEFGNAIVNSTETIVNKLYETRLTEALDSHSTYYNNYLRSISELRKRRKRQIFKWTFLVGLLAISIYLGLRFSKVIKPSSITIDVLIALFSTGLGNVIGYLFSMFKLDVKKISSVSKEEFVKREKHFLFEKFNEDFWEELSKKISEPRTDINAIFLKQLFSAKLDPLLINTNSKNQQVLDNLHIICKKFVAIINAYLTKVDFLYKKYSLIFQDTERNIEKIELITKHIKETAIKPSFDLLNETTNNLEQVNRKIQSLD